MSEVYPRPPITEAIIQFNVSPPLTTDELRKISAKLKPEYPEEQVILDVGLTLNEREPDKPTVQKIEGRKRLNRDATRMALLMPEYCAHVRLAPYPGWEVLKGEFLAIWKIWKDAVGFRKVTRVAVRYVNRIDVPGQEGDKIRPQDYLNAYAATPPMDADLSYAMQSRLRLPNGRTLLLNTLTMPPALLNHVSLGLDIDLFIDADLPQRDDELSDLLDSLRAQKNDIFEKCVTDRARELFRK